MLQKILFSNFLGQNRQGGPNINELLEKPDGLLRLLEDDTFISEFKSGFGRIKEYMTYQRFEELIDLVTVVGDQNDKKRSYKFPLTSSELLSSDNAKIQEFFLPSTPKVVLEQKVTRSIEKEVEQEVDEEDNEEEEVAPKAPTSTQKEEVEGAGPEGVEGEVSEAKESKEEVDQSGEKEVKEEAILAGVKESKEGTNQQGEQEEQFGDFVEAPPKKKKIVKVKQVVEVTETIKEEKQPLIFRLFCYFSEPINYTLTAYVSKILLSLLNKKPVPFLSRLFQAPNEQLQLDFFSHIGSRSMVDLLVRIFTIEKQSYLQERSKMMAAMISYLLKAESTDALTNIGACVGEVYEKVAAHAKTPNPVKQLGIYISKIPELLTLLLELFSGENANSNLHCIPIINQLLANFSITDQYSLVQTFMEKYLQGVTSRLKSYLQEDRRRLGPQAVRMVESLNTCLKADQVKQILSNNRELFPTLLSLIRKYPLNNIFHNQAEKLITTSLSSTPNLIRNVIDSSKILSWLEEEAKQQEQRKQSKKQYSKKGYFGHLFVICRYLRQNAQKHPSIAELVEDPRFNFVQKVIMEQEEASAQKMLGGLAKKQTKHAVLHTKESILEAHAAFLAGAPSAVLETDIDDPMLNPILLEELQKQLDGVELQNETSTEQVVSEEKHKAELIQENDHHKSAFWKMHLDYDVDGLIDEIV